MRAGISGAQLEGALQKLIGDYPEIISGSQIQPGSDDPPRFVLLAREAPIGQWSLDHLLADQFGVLTLVECKLNQNPEARRDVLGQMIEYAAHGRSIFAGGGARNLASRYWDRGGGEFSAELVRQFGDGFDEETFWIAVDDALRHDRMRLIIAADELRPEVRTSIEYLNREMQNVEVLGLELRCYGENEYDLVLVPRIIGQTQEVITRKAGVHSAPWTLERLKEALAGLDDNLLRGRLNRLISMATEQGTFKESVARLPRFLVANPGGQALVSVNLDGTVYFVLKADYYPDTEGQRDQFAAHLQDLGLLPSDYDLSTVLDGRTALRTVQRLSDEEFEQFEQLLRSLRERGQGEASGAGA